MRPSPPEEVLVSEELLRPSNGVRKAQHAAVSTTELVKYVCLFLLVLQNSGTFLVTRYTRNLEGPMYRTTAVVLLVEAFKIIFCLVAVWLEAGSVSSAGAALRKEIWEERQATSKLALPAFCYTLQNNLIFVAVGNLSAAAAQVLYQTKTLSTAFFSVVILGKWYGKLQWLSFFLLGLGVVLVQNQDSKSSALPEGSSPIVGVAAALSAATLSGFAGVYLELMFTTGGVSLWMRNVQLGLFAIPLQLLAVFQQDWESVRTNGLLYGFHLSTWFLVLLQFAGGLLAAMVIKYAGNILKTFATVLAILCTCVVSIFAFNFNPTPLFWGGVAMVGLSIWMYSRR